MNKPVYRSGKKQKQKPFVKVMINTRNSKRINIKKVKNDIKIINCGEGEYENIDSFFLECVWAYMTISLKQGDIGRG